MSTKVVFSHGDLIEFEWPYKGNSRIDGPLRIRAIVAGFRVDEEKQVSVHMKMGRRSFEWSVEGENARTSEYITQAEPRLEWISLDYLLGDEADLELVRRGNSLGAMDPFIMDE